MFKSVFGKKKSYKLKHGSGGAGPCQRVVIPAGTVNPLQTTIVEIPANLQNVETVVAKGKQTKTQTSCSGLNEDGPPPSPAPRARSPSPVKNRSMPPQPAANRSMPQSPSAYRSMSPQQQPQPQQAPQRSMSPQQSPNPCVCAPQSPRNTTPCPALSRSMSPSPSPPPQGYTCSTPQDILNKREAGFGDYEAAGLKKYGSMYKDFDPYIGSTPIGYEPTPYSIVEAMKNFNMTFPTPQQKSFINPRPPASPLPTQHPRQMPPQGIAFSATSSLMTALDKLEFVELEKIQKDLRDFQTARRRLIFDAANLSDADTASGEAAALNDDSEGQCQLAIEAPPSSPCGICPSPEQASPPPSSSPCGICPSPGQASPPPSSPCGICPSPQASGGGRYPYGSPDPWGPAGPMYEASDPCSSPRSNRGYDASGSQSMSPGQYMQDSYGQSGGSPCVCSNEYSTEESSGPYNDPRYRYSSPDTNMTTPPWTDLSDVTTPEMTPESPDDYYNNYEDDCACCPARGHHTI